MSSLTFARTAFAAASLLLSAVALAADTFNNLPAPTSFTIVGTGLPDGRFVIYNGANVYFQSAPGMDAFNVVASGYEGDPSFIAVSPSGNTLLLGAGGFGQPYTGDIYSLDVASPQDFTPAAIATNRSHYAAVFLTENLVLIDAGDFVDSELAILDLNAKSGALKTITVKPQSKQIIVDPKPGFSASLAYDPDSERVYAMDANARELRYFNRADMLAAFTGSTLLDWENDSTLVGAVGQYVGGGASGVTTQGYVVLGGSLGFTGPGMVQVVNPLTGAVLNDLDPTNDQGYTQVLFNPFSGAAIIQQSGFNYSVSETELITPPVQPQLPAAGAGMLALLTAAMAYALRKKLVQ